ncbi:peroxide stress protein YaaA [Thioclava sp. FR2]|uniref:peroxide stress protein YaaA n=1 Tax=Thioclava sp. FR2 TaxID=3445780 RepID=UPI003EB9229C
MLTVISPAKKLDETPYALPDGLTLTDPEFAKDALKLARIARKLTVDELRRLSGISENLARLNKGRFAAFSATPNAGTVFPAVHCFAGDTYVGLQARTMSSRTLHWATSRLRILSGLYGLLRPLDAIQAYRLEMGSRLANPKGPDLYAYWGDRLAKSINQLAQEKSATVIVNCASVEYFAAVNRKCLKPRVVTPLFMEETESGLKTVSFWAKRARGSMTRFICDNELSNPADLQTFSQLGYRFRSELSGEDKLVFSRPVTAEAAA